MRKTRILAIPSKLPKMRHGGIELTCTTSQPFKILGFSKILVQFLVQIFVNFCFNKFFAHFSPVSKVNSFLIAIIL